MMSGSVTKLSNGNLEMVFETRQGDRVCVTFDPNEMPDIAEFVTRVNQATLTISTADRVPFGVRIVLNLNKIQTAKLQLNLYYRSSRTPPLEKPTVVFKVEVADQKATLTWTQCKGEVLVSSIAYTLPARQLQAFANQAEIRWAKQSLHVVELVSGQLSIAWTPDWLQTLAQKVSALNAEAT